MQGVETLDMSETESHLTFQELVAGAPSSFSVPAKPQTPDAILAVDEPELRQRAVAAWESTWNLNAVLALWAKFLWCGLYNTRLDRNTQTEIRTNFPLLQDLGPVLDVLANQKKIQGYRREERNRADALLGIDRSTPRLKSTEKRQLRGPRLQQLIANFQHSLEAHLRSLQRLGVRSPAFQEPEEVVVDNFAPITAMTLDFTGNGPPIDFAQESKNALRVSAWARLFRELRVLRLLLETQPIAALQKSGLDEEPDGSHRGVFRRNGSDWEIRIGNGKLQPYTHLVGLLCIYELIQNPDVEYWGLELRDVKLRAAGASKRSAVPVCENAVAPTIVAHAGEMADEQTVQAMRARMFELKRKYSDACELKTDSQRHTITVEMEQLHKQLRSVVGPSGQPTKFSPEEKKARDAAIKAIKRAITSIEEKDSRLANHFRNSLHYKPLICYRPEEPIDWN